MKQPKINKDQAIIEINNWLDFKRISERKREENQMFIDNISDEMERGSLILNEDFSFKYQLLDPIKSDEGNVVLDELNFKPRIRQNEINKNMRGLKSDDADGRVMAYIAAAVSENRGLISKMVTEDYSICQSIIMFFL